MKVPTAGQAQTDPRQTRAYRWVLGVGVTAIAVLGLVLLLLLTQATNNQELYERNYARLFVLNVVVAAVLLLVFLFLLCALFSLPKPELLFELLLLLFLLLLLQYVLLLHEL